MDLHLFDKMDRANGNHLLDKMVRGRTSLKGFPSWSARGVFGRFTLFPLARHTATYWTLVRWTLGLQETQVAFPNLLQPMKRIALYPSASTAFLTASFGQDSADNSPQKTAIAANDRAHKGRLRQSAGSVNKGKNMDTIHPLGLATMMATHQPFALIDVRPRDQFECSHISGARSIPLNRLCPEKILREHGNDDSGPVFLVCRRGIRASLAAGMLRQTGRLRPIIVAGGMELWEAQGLPTVHTFRMQMPPLMRQLLYAGRQRLAVLRVARKKVRNKIEREFPRRPTNNDWWCRCEFQPRQARRS
ncbi:MAG: rhodanese-like domain-containing protein [Chthoniobacterales bacterium]